MVSDSIRRAMVDELEFRTGAAEAAWDKRTKVVVPQKAEVTKAVRFARFGEAYDTAKSLVAPEGCKWDVFGYGYDGYTDGHAYYQVELCDVAVRAANTYPDGVGVRDIEENKEAWTIKVYER